MMRFHGLVSLVALIGLGGPAWACINDSESSGHEREFRSQYGDYATLPAADKPARRPLIDHNLLIGGGAVMLIGAFSLAANRARSRD